MSRTDRRGPMLSRIWQRVARWARVAWVAGQVLWPFIGGIVLAAMAAVVAFLKTLPADAALFLVVGVFACVCLGLLASYAIYEKLSSKILRARIATLIEEGEVARIRRQDHASWARAIDEWRGRVGRLPKHIRVYVLVDGGDRVTVPLKLLKEILRDFCRWR